MIRFAILALLVCVIVRWAVGKWPWEYLKGPPTRVQEARRLLGVRAGAGADEIRAAHRRLAASTHPDRGGNDADLAQLNAARDLLLDERNRQGHDLP